MNISQQETLDFSTKWKQEYYIRSDAGYSGLYFAGMLYPEGAPLTIEVGNGYTPAHHILYNIVRNKPYDNGFSECRRVYDGYGIIANVTLRLSVKMLETMITQVISDQIPTTQFGQRRHELFRPFFEVLSNDTLEDIRNYLRTLINE